MKTNAGLIYTEHKREAPTGQPGTAPHKGQGPTALRSSAALSLPYTHHSHVTRVTLHEATLRSV